VPGGEVVARQFIVRFVHVAFDRLDRNGRRQNFEGKTVAASRSSVGRTTPAATRRWFLMN